LFVATSHDNAYTTMTQDYILAPRRLFHGPSVIQR